MKNIFQPTCTCDCHKDDCDILHCLACCKYCGQKYIDKKGNIDLERFNNIIREFPYKNPPYIDGSDYIVKKKYIYYSTKIKDKRQKLNG